MDLGYLYLVGLLLQLLTAEVVFIEGLHPARVHVRVRNDVNVQGALSRRWTLLEKRNIDDSYHGFLLKVGNSVFSKCVHGKDIETIV